MKSDLSLWVSQFWLRLSVSALLMSLLTGLTACSRTPAPNEAFAESLASASHALQSGQALDLESLIDEPWDTLWIVGPYTSVEQLNQHLPAPLPGNLTQSGIEKRDDIHLFIYGSSSEISGYATIPRNRLDFQTPGAISTLYKPYIELIKMTGNRNSLKVSTGKPTAP